MANYEYVFILFLFIQLAFISVRRINHTGIMSLNKYVFSSLLFWLFSNPFLLPVVSNLCFFPPPLTLRYALSRGTATSNGWVFEACPTASSTNVILSCCDVVFEMSHWGSAVWSIDWSALVHRVPLRNGDANIHKVTEGEGFKNRVRGDWRQPGGQDNMEGDSEKNRGKDELDGD